MKKWLVLALMVLVMMLTVSNVAFADEKLQWPSFDREILNYTEGTVISHNASMRVEPKESAKRICSVYNGQYLKIIGMTGNWYIVDLSNLEKAEGYSQGYILSYYVVPNYRVVYLRQGGPIYPYAGSEKRIGYLSAGEFYTVLGETNNYWIINARTCAAYLPKSVSTFTSDNIEYYYDNYAEIKGVVVSDSAKIYSGPSSKWNKVSTLEKNTNVLVLWSEGDWYAIKYNDDGAQVIAYIRISDVQL